MSASLPEECLWLIVSYLHHERAALHALLLSSTTFFRIAVSFLYASPFRLLHTEPNEHWTLVERTRRYDRLVHLLIHSSQLLPDQTSSNDGLLIRLPRYGPEVTALPSPSTVDYLSYYTDMFHDPMMHETFMTLFPTIPNCYHANVIWYPSMVQIRNRIELAMMDRLSPQLTSLTIVMPIQVPRVKVPWMANLRRLEILGTDTCCLTDRDLESEHRTVDTHRTSSRAARNYEITRLDKTLMFIWDHQRLFSTLRELKIEDKPVSFHHQPGGRLIELVEAMGDRLEVLDVQFWPDAVLFLDRIPTRHLKSLLLHVNKEPAPLFTGSGNMSTFLNQCPKLNELRMYTGEKDLLQAWRSETVLSGNGSSLGALGMTKLKRLDLAGLSEDMAAVVNEASDLFAPTLETLTVRSWFSGKLATVPLSWSGSVLAQLTGLDLEGEVAWTFDYASLLNCPRLCRIRLAFTGPMPSRSSKKQPAINTLTQIVTLQDLELKGNWETLVNRGWPEVITRISRLERLDLLGCEGITADHVFKLVQGALEKSEHRTQGRGLTYEQGYQLRWVIMNKRLEDSIQRQWNTYRWIFSAPTPLSISVQRVRFSFVATARPSR